VIVSYETGDWTYFLPISHMTLHKNHGIYVLADERPQQRKSNQAGTASMVYWEQLEALYREKRQQLLVCALAVTRRFELAEDAVQEAFFHLYRLSEAPRNLKAYVFRAVRNAAVDQLRRKGPAVMELTDCIFDGTANPRDQAITSQEIVRLEEAMKMLSEDERESVILHLYSGLRLREIAEVRSLSLNTISSWYRRGLAKLQKQMEDGHE
jgi:RNA polymerase sigma factor (sigma-70 family)